MKLVKLPDGTRNGRYVYVNPDNVIYLYERDDKTYIVMIDTEQDSQGLCVSLPIDEVAGRLWFRTSYVTHWQSLPTPPKGE